MAKVLVVEDERIVAKDLERTLRRLGHSVPATASSADDAIRMAEEHRPDLVLMDIHLDGPREGIAAATEMRSRMNVAVVYLTAYADDDTVARARETEPFGYLVKPFNERELHSTVEVALHRHRTESRKRQSDRMISLGVLAAGVAHEINNPLSFVTANLGFVSGALADVMAEIQSLHVPRSEVAEPIQRLREAGKAIDEALEGGERVRRIVADLKAFAHPDDAPRAPTPLWSALETALRLCASQIRHRAEVVREPGPAPLVLAGAGRLEQVFINLLINAAQAIPEGDSRSHRITVTTRTSEGRAVVEIADTGKGIAPEMAHRIFEPFFTTKPVGVGTGLGLSICQGILTEIGGDIAVESVVGRGTLFRITLPAAPAEPAAGPVSASLRAPAARRGRILAVDDEPFLLTLLGRILGDAHDVTAVGTPAEALAKLQAGERFDVVLCDLMMPGMNGMELFEAVSALSPEQADRFVFLTGGAVAPHLCAFLDERPGRCVHKPFTSGEIRDVVESRLRKRD